MEDEYEEVVR